MRRSTDFSWKYEEFRKFPNCCIELCIPYQYKYEVATKESSLFDQLNKLEGCSERAMIFFSSLAWSQGGHTMLSPFFQPCYSTVLNENLITCFQLSPDVQQSITTVLKYSATQMRICEFCCG